MKHQKKLNGVNKDNREKSLPIVSTTINKKYQEHCQKIAKTDSQNLIGIKIAERNTYFEKSANYFDAIP